jgi:hypothetical protein
MAFNTVINLDVARLSDGFYLVGGSDRKLQLSDINIEMTGTQDLQVAFPNFAACTLLAMEEYTAKGDILAATGANVPVPLSVGTNGQVLTANSAQATGLEWKTIETISYSTITTNTTAVAGTAYIVGQAASQIEITLPATAAVGSVVKVYGISSNLWTILQNAGQVIHFLGVDSTTGTGGSLYSTAQYDAIELVCVVANNEWLVVDASGNFGIV